MHERVYAFSFMLVAIVVTGATIFIGIALWPFKDTIGEALTIVIYIVLGCGCVELVSWTYHRHEKRKIERSRAILYAKVIESDSPIAAYVHDDKGSIYHLSAYNENAKTFPVQIEETTKEDIDLVKEWTKQGMSEREIAGRLMIPRNQVRKLQGK